MEEINKISADWRASGQEIEEYMTDGNWAVVQTVKWMETNGIDRLTGDMLYRLSVDGTVELKREGMAQMYFSSDGTGVRFLTMNSPVAKDGQIHADSVLLVAPSSGPLPEVHAVLSIMQPQVDWIASQRYYEVSMGSALHGEDSMPFLGVSDASDAVIGGADGPTSVLVK